jgi:hypothetical protein
MQIFEKTSRVRAYNTAGLAGNKEKLTLGSLSSPKSASLNEVGIEDKPVVIACLRAKPLAKIAKFGWKHEMKWQTSLRFWNCFLALVVAS